MSMRLKILYQGARLYWRIFKPITMGVKVLLVRDERVLLVRHSYQPGWFLPGGGVKRGETIETAVRREVREELGGTLGDLTLLGVYSSIDRERNDHVLVFVCHAFEIAGANDKEIVAVEYFPLAALPPDTDEGSARRVQELLGERPLAYVTRW